MKFGKAFQAMTSDGWKYIEYKELKQMLNEISGLDQKAKRKLQSKFTQQLKKDVILNNTRSGRYRDAIVNSITRLKTGIQKFMAHYARPCSQFEQKVLKRFYSRCEDNLYKLRKHSVLNYLVRDRVMHATFIFWCSLNPRECSCCALLS